MPSTAESSRGRSPAHRIVVGVDGSEGATEAAAWTASEARARNSQLELVCAWSWTPVPLINGYSDVDLEAGVRKALADKAEQAISQTLDSVDTSGLEVIRSVREGRPVDVLLAAAETADILVVGSRGLGRAKELFLGSVSHAVSHHAKVPTVIVPHPKEMDG